MSAGLMSALLALSLGGCTHSVYLNSKPQGATVYLDGEQVGTTPYQHVDRGAGPTDYQVKLIKRGYETLRDDFGRGFMGSYPEQITFELKPGS
ncbi:MAG: PEGA domain-containing protein [Planctomycetota bacterium]